MGLNFVIKRQSLRNILQEEIFRLQKWGRFGMKHLLQCHERN